MRAPSIQSLSFLFLLVLGFVVAFFFPSTYDPDIWWHLKTGEWILANGAVPWHDPFGDNTQGVRWIAYSWLAEILFYLLDRLDPLLGLRWLQGCVAAAMLGVLYLHARLASGKPRLALLLSALIVIPVFPWVARPQIFSFLFVAVTLLVLWWGRHRNERVGWLLPPVMALWANLHIYFVLGLGLIWLHMLWPWLTRRAQGQGADRGAKPGMVVAAVATLAPLLNPYGPALYDEALRLTIHGASDWPADVIVELQSPNFHDWPRLVFFGWMVIAFLAFVLPGKPAPALQVLLYVFLLFRSLQYGRDIPFFLIVMLPIVAERFATMPHPLWQRLISCEEAWLVRSAAPRALLHWMLAAAAILVMAVLPWRFRDLGEQFMTNRQYSFPAGAADYLLQHRPQGPLYHSLGWGGYLIYRLAPAYRVYIDGRTQLYSRAFWEAHDLVRRGQAGWEKSLADSGARIVLWSKKEALASLLRLSPEWKAVYEDADAVVFVKREAKRDQ